MPRSRNGSFRLFRFAGIDVFLHWSWFFVAVFEIQGRNRNYTSLLWNVAEYLALFVIVLLHEFGHSLACRQVGGSANMIVLWPLGGVAYVTPPQRPAATLWSIAAGPLVNVALIPVFYIAAMIAGASGWAAIDPNVVALLKALSGINLLLLVFNLLPIYPLDGGQILRSLLWFLLGRARSLMVTAVLGIVVLVVALGWALWSYSLWNAVLVYFLLANCWKGLQQARRMTDIAELVRRAGFACPSCHAAPPFGDFWRCPQCEQQFDPFSSESKCPCTADLVAIPCLDCGATHPIGEWAVPAAQATA
jgi:Zn-dependent protease